MRDIRLFGSTLASALIPAVAFVAWPTIATAHDHHHGHGGGGRSCEDLASLRLPHTEITAAESVPAGTFTPPDGSAAIDGLPAFCRVAGIAHPTSDSDIGFEVWLPDDWNGRYRQQGNGGFAGAIPYPSLSSGVLAGFATAGTNDGHTTGDASWAIGHPEKVVDFGYRSLKETHDNAQLILRALYRHESRRSYFVGCSDGGREALMVAQRFPEDFDGILAGAPANDWNNLFAGFVWNEQALLDANIPQDKLAVIEAATLAQCDGIDGIEDGVIDDPRRCDFNPDSLACSGADQPGCLTAPQVASLRAIMMGPSNPRTGRQIFPGYFPGTAAVPSSWPAWIVSPVAGASIQAFFGNNYFADIVFEDPDYDIRNFDFDEDVRFGAEKAGHIIDSTRTDLGAFRRHGGKILQYHGWDDPAISALSSINYHDRVADTRSGRNVDEFYRLFMAPGVVHCAGGPGPNDFGNVAVFGALPPGDAEHDVFTALERWVEHGVPPRRVVATKYVNDDRAQGVERTRPLCVYPLVARYIGFGSTDDARFFFCGRERN